MDFKVKFEFLFIGKEGDTFARNYFYESDSAEKGGKMFVAFGMVGNPVLAEEVSERIFRTLRETFFASQAPDPYERFEESLKEANDAVRSLQKEKNFKFVANLSVIAGVICNDTLYLSQAGEAEAYLIRRNHVSIVSEGLSDLSSDPDEIFTNIASGILESSDLVVFSSTRLLRYLTKNSLARALAESDLQAGLEDLKSATELEVTGKVGILAIKVGEEAGVEVKVEKRGMKDKLRALNIGKVGGVLSAAGSRLAETYRGVKMRRAQPRMPRDRKFVDWGNLTRDKILAILVVLIVILGIGIFVVKSKSDKQKYIAELEQTLTEIESDLETAQTKGNYDKASAAALLSRAEEKAMEVLNSGYLRAKASSVLDEIQKQRDGLDSIVRISDPKVLVDLSVKRSTVDALGILPYRDHFFVYEYNALYEVVLDQVREPLTIDENEIVVSGAYFEDRDALVFLTKSNRLLEYKDGKFTFMDTADNGWHGGVDLATWNTKVYILDPASSQIWKYTRKEREGYSGAEAYNVSNTDLTKTTSLVIDASIYVLTEEGKLMRFYSGNESKMAIKKEPILDYLKPTSVYTDEDIYQIFVLDSEAKRILIYNKDPKDLMGGDLTYSGQYLLENVGTLKDLFFDKATNKLYVLDNTKVYEIEM